MANQYSKDLRLGYRYESGALVFEDGVCYRVDEAIHLSTADPDTIRAAHQCKKLFDGEILPPVIERER